MKWKLEDFTGIGVVGCGKMGCDAIANFLETGFKVVGYDASADHRGSAREKVLQALRWIEKNRRNREKQPVYAEGFADEAIERFEIVESLDAFIAQQGEYQVVFEAIFEDMKLKQGLFVELAAGLSDDHIYMTNTSCLNIIEMGQPAGIENRLFGAHFMNPAYQMIAVEMVWTEKVDGEVFDLGRQLLEKMGKLPFTAANVPGFWVNKILVPMMLDAMRILERGEITVDQGDQGLKFSLGHPQGVFKLSDLISTKTMYRVALALYLATQDVRYYPPAILVRMVNEGHNGQSTGEGFWKWDGFKTTEPVDFSEHQIKSTDTLLIA